MISLGGVQLPDGLIWENEFSSSGVSAERRTAVDGSEILFSRRITGRDIDLVSMEDRSWFSREQVEMLSGMASNTTANYILELGANAFIVRFRNEDGGFSFTPVDPVENGSSTGCYYGRIKLRELGGE
ncbi:hypothetical protein [Limisalsivibrio acetivorans]|uniref:hypothetical protein n=1 Tax=Limisalsivibrio acetivorans TaxID=1304888 RepID=UPI0003B352F1|nr:hypothetical protein [Limisalsivibrio acetivorans]